MAPRPGDKSLQAWVSPAFADAVGAVAEVTGTSKSDLIRDSLIKQLESIDRLAEHLTGDERDHTLAKSSAHLRHTLVPVTPDDMGVDHDTLQQRHLWKCRGPVRVGGTQVGAVVETGFWSKELGDLLVDDSDDGLLRKAVWPGGTAFVGVRWTPDAWSLIESGDLDPHETVKDKLRESAL